MRKVVLALVIGLWGMSSVRAEGREWAEKLFDRDGTKGLTVHNFGNVPRGSVLSHRFVINNIYTVPLQIAITRVSCGCVTAGPPVQTLQPKETGAIDVIMDARKFTGLKSVSIVVTVGPQFISTATLQVTANSRADVVFNPGEVNFGVVTAGQSPSQDIDVEYAGALDWRLSGVAEHNLPLETKLDELYRKPGKAGYRLHVTLKSDAPAGTHRFELLLQSNDPAGPAVPVLVQATVQAPLSVAPPNVRFGAAKVGQEITQKVFVNGSANFRILDIEGQADGISADYPSGKANVQVVTLKWVPKEAGDLKRELVIKTDLNGGAATTVTVEGTAAP
jgi:hypothetical protein